MGWLHQKSRMSYYTPMNVYEPSRSIKQLIIATAKVAPDVD